MSFAKAPMRLTDAGHKVETWTIPVSAEILAAIPPAIQDDVAGAPPHRFVSEDSMLFRLRCIKWPSSELPDEHAWSIADTCWVPYVYFTFNGKPLELRKKIHHGKDMPIDLSNLIQAGENTLEIALLRSESDTTYLDYALAVEVVGTTSRSVIKEQCVTAGRLPAMRVLDAIKRKLSTTSDGDDDEIAIVQSNLTISLVDPFSASKMCDIPVRSKACLHNDCFDLETFLMTRERKGDSSVTEKWRCPICNADARPQHLVVDGFLQEVRKELEQRRSLDTRAIIVAQDGKWTPRVEPKEDGERDDSNPCDNTHRMTVPLINGARPTPTDLEVIDLSD
jgi:zinc finger MIZ domain-containing protein